MGYQASVSGGAIYVSGATGDPASDFVKLYSAFSAAPAGAIIEFKPNETWEVWAGAVVYKPKQIIRHNNSVIKRANEVVATTTAPVTLSIGSITIPVTSASGFIVGQRIAIRGQKAGGDVLIGWEMSCTSIGASSITVSANYQAINITSGGYESGPVVLSGATVMTKGCLIDGAVNMSADDYWKATDIVIDGNRVNNSTYNRWEYTSEVKQAGGGCEIDGLRITNAAGEGLIQWGNGPVARNVWMDTLGGNGVHFNEGCYNPVIDTIRVFRANQYIGIGHEDGGIIASNGTYRVQLSNFLVEECRLAGVGSFDQSDNSFDVIRDGFVRNCQGAGLDLFSPYANRSNGLRVRDVEVSGCGTVLIGCDKSNAASQGLFCSDFEITGLTLIDTGAYVAGLRDSKVQIRQIWGDSTVLNTGNAAAGRASNYVTPTGASLNGLVQIASCWDTEFDINSKDNAAAPTGYSVIYAYSSNGDAMANCGLTLSSQGGRTGIAIGGAISECRGLLKSRRHLSGYTGVDITLQKNANLPAAYQKPRGNKFEIDVEFDAATANTFGCKANSPNTPADNGGWLTVSGKIRCKSTAGGLSYGIATNSSTASLIRWNDLEIIGPASNFWPIYNTAADATLNCRVFNLRTYPAANALASNWVAESTTITLPAV